MSHVYDPYLSEPSSVEDGTQDARLPCNHMPAPIKLQPAIMESNKPTLDAPEWATAMDCHAPPAHEAESQRGELKSRHNYFHRKHSMRRSPSPARAAPRAHEDELESSELIHEPQGSIAYLEHKLSGVWTVVHQAADHARRLLFSGTRGKPGNGHTAEEDVKAV